MLEPINDANTITTSRKPCIIIMKATDWPKKPVGTISPYPIVRIVTVAK